MNSDANDSVQTIDCDTTVRRLWDYLDEELDASRYAEVEAHVRDCVHCAEHFAFAQHFLGAVSEALDESHDPAALRAQVLKRLADDGFRAA